MKKIDKTYIIISMLFVIVLTILNFFKYNFNKINNSILEKKWYHYNNVNGYYDIIYMEKNSFKYQVPLESNSKEFINCNNYVYNKKNQLLSLNCGKDIKIVDFSDNRLDIQIDGKDKVFFDTLDASLNYEFELYFGKTMSEFKNSKSQAKDFLKINEKKLDEVLKTKEYSKIVFVGDKCSSVDCVLFLDVLEKWISKTENIYYFDTKELNDKLIKRLNSMNKNLENSINEYNNVYPKVLIVNNNKIIDFYDVKCSGFNCKKYYSNEF